MSPFTTEEEWAFEQDMKARRELQVKLTKEMEKDQRNKLKELHHMHCPKCGMGLTEITFREARVDKCFSCGGTWFDAGEVEVTMTLEKPILNLILAVFKKSR
jgi:hypothetical protein